MLLSLYDGFSFYLFSLITFLMDGLLRDEDLVLSGSRVVDHSTLPSKFVRVDDSTCRINNIKYPEI